jgi:hydroxyacylglutathione hydrolase
MFELADGVYQLSGKPPNLINVYLVDGILVDAGSPQAHKRIFLQLGDLVPTAHLVTHAHPDHYGSSHAVCERFGIPLMTGANDADAIETSGPEANDTFVARNILSKMPPPPAHPVATRLKEGDKVGSFEVIDTPGHSRGHIALWRAGDKTLVLADVLFNLNPFTMKTGLREPPLFLTLDPAQNRDSARKVAELEPELILFGHGPALRSSEAFTWFVATLPR